MMDWKTVGESARAAARSLATAGTAAKNAGLLAMAEALLTNSEEILTANAADIEAAKAAGMRPSLIDRLTLTPARIQGMSDGVREVAALTDPVGEEVEGYRRPNGLSIRRVRVPLGVVGIIYEARPNVTADAAALCVKAGNATLLRGGKEAIRSNTPIVKAQRAGLT
ncbi:MAG: gamma-glutamyl-phosphate reductase, partial [Clostridia bacterium]|nr:gamma-glutamyl-phosphate reductase [Clostridia bacterium]